MNNNIFHSIILWGLVLFFVFIVFLFIHPTSRKEILGSRDLPTKPSRLSSALSRRIEQIFAPIFSIVKRIIRILD